MEDMIKVHATVNIGFCGAEHRGDFEFPPGTTETEIDDAVYEWALGWLDWDYEIVDGEV